MHRLVVLAVLVTSCKAKDKAVDPPPAPVAAVPVVAAPPREAPLDPVRVEAEHGNRDALATMAKAIMCPQQLPSTFARYCHAADEFAGGTAAELPEGDTLLIGEAAIIEPGSPSVSTLGTGMPVVLLLRRTGTQLGAKQVAFREVAADRDALATVAGRIGKTIDGKWDHVEVPASLADQVKAVATVEPDPIEASGGAYWPRGLDGMELRRTKDRWMLVGSPEGPTGRHVIAIFVDKMKLLSPKDKSTQTITIVHL